MSGGIYHEVLRGCVGSILSQEEPALCTLVYAELVGLLLANLPHGWTASVLPEQITLLNSEGVALELPGTHKEAQRLLRTITVASMHSEDLGFFEWASEARHILARLGCSIERGNEPRYKPHTAGAYKAWPFE